MKKKKKTFAFDKKSYNHSNQFFCFFYPFLRGKLNDHNKHQLCRNVSHNISDH